MSAIQNTSYQTPALKVRPALISTAATASPGTPKPAQGGGDALMLRSPAAALAPAQLRTGAMAAGPGDRPPLNTPDDYKNYVIKIGSSIALAKNDLTTAQATLDDVSQQKADADAAFGKPLRAAQKVMNDTTALFQAPVTRLGNDLQNATRALDDATFPGKRHAAELDAQAGQLRGQLDNVNGRVADAQNQYARAQQMVAEETSRRTQAYATKARAGNDPATQADATAIIQQATQNLNSYRAQMQQANADLAQLRQEAHAKSGEYNNVVMQANTERARRTPDSDPQLTELRNRVQQLQGDLKQAQATFEAKTSEPRAKLAAEQTSYNSKMAPFVAKANQAQADVNAAKQAINKIADELDQIKNSGVGGMTKAKWKMFSHFDVDKFWKEQGASIQAAVNQAAGR